MRLWIHVRRTWCAKNAWHNWWQQPGVLSWRHMKSKIKMLWPWHFKVFRWVSDQGLKVQGDAEKTYGDGLSAGAPLYGSWRPQWDQVSKGSVDFSRVDWWDDLPPCRCVHFRCHFDSRHDVPTAFKQLSSVGRLAVGWAADLHGVCGVWGIYFANWTWTIRQCPRVRRSSVCKMV